MNRSVVVSSTPITLSTGAPVAPGDELVDIDLAAERAAIDAGAIVVLERDPDPPAEQPTKTESANEPDPPAEQPKTTPQRRRRRPTQEPTP